jgi:hypothetical protein
VVSAGASTAAAGAAASLHVSLITDLNVQAYVSLAATTSGLVSVAGTAGASVWTGAGTAVSVVRAAPVTSAGVSAVASVEASTGAASAVVSSVAMGSDFSAYHQLMHRQGVKQLTLGVLTFCFLGDFSLDPKNLAKKPLPSALVFSTLSWMSACFEEARSELIGGKKGDRSDVGRGGKRGDRSGAGEGKKGIGDEGKERDIP